MSGHLQVLANSVFVLCTHGLGLVKEEVTKLVQKQSKLSATSI